MIHHLRCEKDGNLEDMQLKIYKNLLKLKKIKQSKTVIRDIRNLFDQGKEDYYKPIGLGNFWNNNDIFVYLSNGDRNNSPSIKEYLDEM